MSNCLHFLLIPVFCLLSFSITAQTIYVDTDATGMNDGSSWTDAYNDLSDALSNANDGAAIWVAAGTYLPGGVNPDTFSRFAVESQVAIFGGFAGTESSVEDRDIIENPTILSGDIGGDDDSMDIDVNKDDNVLHVLYIDSLLAGPVTLDGLTVKGGYNNDFLDNISDYFWRGAGLYAFSPVTIQQCTFTENRANSGAAIYLGGGGTSGSLLERSIFINNRALGQSAVFISGANDITVRSCDFVENSCNRGVFYPANCNGVLVEDCLFEENVNSVGFGGAAFSWQNYDVLYRDCVFRNNFAQNGAALYIDARNDLDLDTDRFRMINCVFENNQAADFGGGALYVWRASYSLDSCTFTNNLGNDSGGAIGHFGEDKAFRITNCVFEDNQADFGAGCCNYGNNTTGYFSGCTFQSNEAFTSGAGSINGFKANITYENCDFSGNNAQWGGAMYVQNDTTLINVSGCNFVGNVVENFGGALNISGGVVSTIEDCFFEGNQAGTGGAIQLSDGENDLAVCTMDRLNFNFNLASGNQAGALNVSNVDVVMTNSLFTNNVADGTGIGGAISLNSSDTSTVSITNVTMVDNTGALAGGIAAWTPDTVGMLTLNLQNSVLINTGPNYVVESGTPTLVSGGGNYVSDDSANAELIAPTDQTEATGDPFFVDPSDFDFHLQAGSPLIDAGVAAGAPAFDLDGTPRDVTPDIGCYEFVIIDDVDELVDESGILKLLPNPIKDQGQLLLENDWRGALTIQLLDAQGRSFKSYQLQKDFQELSARIEVRQLPAGKYFVVVEFQGQQLIQRLVKL